MSKELFVKGENLTAAYHNALRELLNSGSLVPCTDWCTLCLESGMTIHIEHPLSEPRISSCFIGGPMELQQYVMEMVEGILDFEIEKGNWAYTYHDRMVNYPVLNKEKNRIDFFNQFSFVIAELTRNPDSRRAVILIRDGSDMCSADPACLQHIQFFIRDNKLDCKVLFRSNDACKASFMNMFALIMIQKTIAEVLDIEVGTYTHRVNSFHCYEKDIPLLKGYVRRIESDDNVTREYKGDWKEMMMESIPEILEKVKELRADR